MPNVKPALVVAVAPKFKPVAAPKPTAVLTGAAPKPKLAVVAAGAPKLNGFGAGVPNKGAAEVAVVVVAAGIVP